ncbi:MAG: DUF493 family protein [Cyclobacteriaceae bacterium]
MSWNRVSFKEKLESQHTFPGKYMFKFIVPIAAEQQVLGLFDGAEVSSKQSKTKKYVSITATVDISASEEVLAVYDKAYKIEGIISL